MKRHNFQDLILDKDSDVEYYRCSEADKYVNLYEKLKDWHKHALTMQAKMADQLEPLYNQIEDLEEQNKEMLDKLKFVVECGGVLLEGQLYDEIIPTIERIEGEQNG